MDESRRSFLKKAGLTGLGIGAGFPLLGAALNTLSEQGPTHAAPPDPATKQWGMVIDLKKCLSKEVRDACAEACSREHNVPKIPDANRAIEWICTEEYQNVFPDQVHAHSSEEQKTAPVLVLCNHCERPSCVRVCPTGATWKRKSDGVVMMDMHRCIGCRYCMAACPFGARRFNWLDPREYIPRDENGELASTYPTRTKGVVEKCTFCAERLRDGREPACVEAARKVPGGEGALTFGNVNDPNSEVSRILRENRTICRRVELGTGPNVYYRV